MSGLRVAIVGAGLMGRWHARAARRAGSEVEVVVDPDLSKAQGLASRCRAAGATTALGEALQLGSIDLVHLCTPLGTHAELALEALEAGCHVIVEKPFTTSLASARQLLDLAAARSRLAIPVHQFPWQRSVRRALSLLPEIAPLRHLSFTACSAGAAERGADAADRVAAEILPHPLSLLATLVPGALETVAWGVQRSAAGEWQLLASHLDTAIDVTISMAGRPPVNQLRLIGERGTLHLDLFHDFVVREPASGSRAGKILRPLTLAANAGVVASANLLGRALRGEAAYPGLDALIRAVHVAARSGGAPPVTPAEILAIAAAWDTIRTAALHDN